MFDASGYNMTHLISVESIFHLHIERRDYVPVPILFQKSFAT